jgi:hypothetical protein
LGNRGNLVGVEVLVDKPAPTRSEFILIFNNASLSGPAA